ncbi:hypothetical protein H6F88_04510 [Oculatella sp. FACHB-28]|uniref:hypothetical protein n=1 Tax=Oculatella sp. FACHB-28 TaxID=2692845 RepID=UPI0016820637|nr:hypothetical protein [Oculatella sp. FACHB-28]MBD1871223.1 hypothetical protein [Cyanobacteria bacterium FACHB-471]MBD2055292.1 hypothetical protein [Oculatella sp. FACHB-28]
MQRPTQRLPIISFGFLLIFSAASAVFVHHVSPLRDTNFQPNSANAGSLIPWLRGVHEDTWLQGASVLAGLLAVSLVLIFRQWSQAETPHSASPSQNVLSKIAGFLISARWIAIGSSLFMALWLVVRHHYGYLYDPSNLGMLIIASLLAIHFTFIFWLWNQLESSGRHTPWYQGVSRKIAQAFLLAYWIGIGATLFWGFQLLFIGYLLGQWLVD